MQGDHNKCRNVRRRQLLQAGAALLAAPMLPAAAQTRPILLGMDGEFGLSKSTSAQAIEIGMKVAVSEINRSGGVLGRKFEIVTRDHRSIPARGIRNIREFAEMPDLAAVFGGRFSPVIIEQLPALKAARLPFLAVWSAADAIVENGMVPNYIFRLSLRDSLAMSTMLGSAQRRGFERVGLLLTNTSWGRSNLKAAEQFTMATANVPKIVATAWYNWTEGSLLDKYQKLVNAGAQAIALVANDDEAAVLVREMAPLPEKERVPVISHWGITGGEFVRQAGPALRQVDLSVVQTFSFFKADPKVVQPFMQSLEKVAGIKRIEDIQSPVGVAHAYDMTHILARAIKLAGSIERPLIRDALEQVRNYKGLIKHYAQPFTAQRHEALDARDLLMARYRDDGVLVPAS